MSSSTTDLFLGVCLLVLSLSSSSSSFGQSMLIAEFMADNKGILLDSEGDSPDWIELYNPTDNPINLEGWHLTDSQTDLTKWAFPATNIAARAADPSKSTYARRAVSSSGGRSNAVPGRSATPVSARRRSQSPLLSSIPRATKRDASGEKSRNR